ncbi:NUDIX domain-containing protein [Amnibacterium kyonggiense]|uniref:Mutator protein MutT n=1 Tax=Amnibacterium kyonggiense TaxID=595671 RepID=A0A4R7FJ67_9MICO|nr:NUDIX domain-containing protein [Amnibacterium kyonggiense]TDS76072.1 mutator protein MutT [Amnibacterium kyonggiense]
MGGAEIWDVTDERGVPTGQTFVRGAPDWPTGRFHVVAATCAVDEAGRLLLTKRAAAKDFAGLWEFPGGSAVAGETSAEAAARELREEAGLRVAPTAFRLVDRFQEDTALFDLYLVAAPADQQPRPDGIEVSEVAWVEVAEVRRRWLDHELADPWMQRLKAFWEPLTAALSVRPSSARRRRVE